LSAVLGIAEILGKGGVLGDGTVVFAVIASGACQSRYIGRASDSYNDSGKLGGVVAFPRPRNVRRHGLLTSKRGRRRVTRSGLLAIFDQRSRHWCVLHV